MRSNVIKAAFVVLYDASLAGKRGVSAADLEETIVTIRRSISLSRKEAQALLEQQAHVISDPLPVALVLAYEGIGAHRVDPDFRFSRTDIEALTTARADAHMSLKRAADILHAHQQEPHPILSY